MSSLFLNFRALAVGGPVVDPYVLRGDPLGGMTGVTSVSWTEAAELASGKDVLFAVHGFNVSYDSGAMSAARLDAELNLGPDALFLGVLWPGDFWLPAVNYPFAGDVSIDCGRRLAAFCAKWMNEAASLSFVSHSLGARLVLEAVKNLKAPQTARTVCLTAGAINSDCLAAEYAAALANSKTVSTLSSTADHVLQLAFPLGDLVADILDDDHAALTPALGYWGPKKPVPAGVRKARIPDSLAYDHGNYMPPATLPAPPTPPDNRWKSVAQFMKNAFREQPQTWP